MRQLFEPLLASLPAEEQADLLAGSAALAAPLFDPAQVAAEPAADSSLATLHGLYWLTANLAARLPAPARVRRAALVRSALVRWLAYLLPRMEGSASWSSSASGRRSGRGSGLIGQILSDPLATTVGPLP